MHKSTCKKTNISRTQEWKTQTLEHQPRTANVIVHVVQHLAPGGLETLVLEMLRFAKAEDSVFVVSLEGNKTVALRHWSKLLDYRDQLYFLDKAPGFSLTTLRALKHILKRLNANVVHTHHIGPLLYGGIATRLLGIKTLIHTEHDAWHLNNQKAARLQTVLLKSLRPQVVADAEFVADQITNKLGYLRVSTIHNGGLIVKSSPMVIKTKPVSAFRFPLISSLSEQQVV